MIKRITSIALCVCSLFLLVGIVSANEAKYTPFKQSPNTQTVYIHDINVQNGSTLLTVDPIQWYEGAEADKLFRKLEPDAGFDQAPDGYIIVNSSTITHAIRLSNNVKVYLQLYNKNDDGYADEISWNESVSLAKFKTLLADEEQGLSDYPYHLTFKHGVVVSITQQYIP